ncbi:MAG: helix-turn-helix transcriptional regulator [Anaerolineaceae bacterium]|nr:helix-turn-helix transcriptional regulator [Anaerolineaceae bacterium]
MSISFSTDRIDENGRELLTYGTPDFPIAFFDDDLTTVKVPWHWHDELEIVVILSGKVSVFIGGCELALNAGEGYFANSGVLHSAQLRSKTGWQHAMVFSPGIIASPNDIIWNTYVSPIITHENLPFVKLTPNIAWQKEILSYAENAWISGALEKPDYALAVRSFLSQIACLMLHNIGTEAEHPYTPKMQRDELRIKKTLRYIETHFREQITIDDIAASASISVSTLLRLYHDILQTTPIQYVLKYRLDQIRDELMFSSGASIAEIAYSCGFNDISYFNRCFLKEYGATPSSCRRQNRCFSK